MQAGTGRGLSCVKIAGRGYKFRPTYISVVGIMLQDKFRYSDNILSCSAVTVDSAVLRIV